MFFTVSTLNITGLATVKKFYKFHEAFIFAISIESSSVSPCIKERQWSDSKQTVIENMYFVRDGSIYVDDDASIPIYSLNMNHLWVNTFRNKIGEFCKKVIDIYKYNNKACPYSVEYFYSHKHSEVLKLFYLLQKDELTNKFYNELSTELQDIKEVLITTSFRIDNVNDKIATLEIKNIKPFMQEFKRRVSILINLYAFGGISELNLCLDNMLTPLKEVKDF